MSVLLLLVLAACNKALDINQNPNRPVEEYMEPSHFLPRVLDITGTGSPLPIVIQHAGWAVGAGQVITERTWKRKLYDR